MAASDPSPGAGSHILIGGTGRAGTTLLVQWFTVMRFDTGFTVEEALARVDPISNAGLEHSLGRTLEVGERLPHVAKSPWFGPKLGDYIRSGDLRVEAAILPMRDLAEAAESRRQVSRRAAAAGHDPAKHPGGILGGARPGAGQKQERQLARRFYELVHTLVTHDVPTYFLRFPEFARGQQDPSLALAPLLQAHGVGREEAREAFARVVRPDLIHTP
jgi:hypothetical protein